jgi:hypothetical protein
VINCITYRLKMVERKSCDEKVIGHGDPDEQDGKFYCRIGEI